MYIYIYIRAVFFLFKFYSYLFPHNNNRASYTHYTTLYTYKLWLLKYLFRIFILLVCLTGKMPSSTI